MYTNHRPIVNHDNNNVFLNVSDQALRKKWKYLRDQYATELSKSVHPKSGAGADEVITCKWQYFNALSFLKDIVKARKSSGNCSMLKTSNADQIVQQQSTSPEIHDEVEYTEPENMTQDQFNVSEIDNDEIPAIAGPSETGEETSKAKRSKLHTVERVKRVRRDDYTTSMLEIERKKLEILSQKKIAKEDKEPEDEHLLFFKTLLPHVRKIRPEHILPFRAKIQDIVQQFAYPISYSVVPTPTNSTPFSPVSTSNQGVPIDEYEGSQSHGKEDFAGFGRLLNFN